MGWFYGFKLHLVINDKGEIIDFQFTQANVNDRAPLEDKNFTKSYLENALAIKVIFLNRYSINYLSMVFTL